MSFELLGPITEENRKKIANSASQLREKHASALKSIESYEPDLKALRKSQSSSLFSYLKPIKSHRKGIFGKAANIIMWKFFQVFQTLLRPILTKLEEKNALLERNVERLENRVQNLERVIKELKSANNT